MDDGIGPAELGTDLVEGLDVEQARVAHGEEVAPHSTFAALKVAPFRRMWIAGMFVFLAVNSQAVARAWLAREITGSNAGLGGVMLAFGVAMLVATPFGGVVADRFQKRTVLVLAQTLLLVSSTWIGVELVLDSVEYWMLLVSSALQAAAFSLFAPARMAYTAELVPGRNLSNAIVLSGMSAEGMRVIGPTIAGMVIGAFIWGMEVIYLVSSSILVLGILMTFTLPLARRRAADIDTTPLQEIADGVRYVRSRPDLRLLLLTSLGVIICVYPFMTFLPSVAAGMFDRGAAGYGLLSAVSAAGALVAGLFVARRSGHHDPWRAVVLFGFGFAASVVAIALSPTFGVAIVMVTIAGGMSLSFQSISNSLLLNLSAFEYHGRVQSIVMLAFSGNGIVSYPLGALADTIGLRSTLALMGLAAALIMAVFAVRRRHLRPIELALDFG
ncbi:MAG: MFS transporter [Acidimicrobiia bacterium]